MKKIILIYLLFTTSLVFGLNPQDSIVKAKSRLESYKQNTMAVDISSIEYNAKCSEYERQLYRLQGQLYTVQNDFTRIKNSINHRKEVTESELAQLNELKTRNQQLISDYERVITEYENYVRSQN
jgi:archaellum component FlaC